MKIILMYIMIFEKLKIKMSCFFHKHFLKIKCKYTDSIVEIKSNTQANYKYKFLNFSLQYINLSIDIYIYIYAVIIKNWVL